MIRPIDIKLNAAHPELPLCEATTFTGAPSSVFIRGVFKSVGNWSITAVYVAVTYPDNTTTTRAAVESAEGVWVATIPGTATSGRTVAGFRILADGIDENGAAVTGYVLGFADFAVLSFFPVPAPGETFFYLRYFDTMPTTAKKMDVTIIGGVLRYFNGTTWQPFADLTNYYTKTETDEQIDRVAAYYITYNAAGDAFPTRAALVNAQTYYSGGVARTPTRNDYAIVLADETQGGAEWRYIYAVADGQTTGQWEAQYPVEGVITFDSNVTRTSANGVKSSGIWSAIWGALTALPAGFTSLYDWCVAQLAGKASTADATLTPIYSDTPTFSEWAVVTTPDTSGYTVRWDSDEGSWAVVKPNLGLINTGITDVNAVILPTVLDFTTGVKITASRTRTDILGYTLGAQSDKPLASEAEAEALRQGKADRAANPTAGNLAALDANGNLTDSDNTVQGTFGCGELTVGYSPNQRYVDILGQGAVPDHVTIIVYNSDSLGHYHYIALPNSYGADKDSILALEREIAPAFDDTATYAEGALVYYNDALYRCTTAVTSAGAWTGSTNWTSASVEDVLAALRTGKADVSAIPYSLGTKTITSGAVSLDDRASNSVTVSATLSPNTLTINFPTATSGKVRDFAMRLNIAAGVTAPEIAWPQGVTLENDGGEVPEIADGGTGGSSTILYFSETENDGTTAKFLVKGETLTAIAQA